MYGRHESSRVSMHSKADFRSSSPSSTVCLKGPRSTVRTKSGLGTVCSYSKGRSVGRREWMMMALLCAVTCSTCTAARRTCRSSSVMRSRNLSMYDCSTASMGWGLSEMVHFSDMTIVARALGEGDDKRSCKLGSKRSASMSVSFPRQSATTLRTPSSELSQCWKSRASTCSMRLLGSTTLCCSDAALGVITSLSEYNRKYWSLACEVIFSSRYGR
mmetsp:Transcript_19750/g.37634  ORF Transcript_19750/g.37634 Transcript_19750/m.37634 type:complete len:216 (-) Transcript_19750:2763-3410(-)